MDIYCVTALESETPQSGLPGPCFLWRSWGGSFLPLVASWRAPAGLAGSCGALFTASLVTWHPPLCGWLSSLPMKTLHWVKGLPYSTLDWASNEIISGKKRGGVLNSPTVWKVSPFKSEVTVADQAQEASMQGKAKAVSGAEQMWRSSQKRKGQFGCLSVSETPRRESATCFFLGPMPRWSLCPSGEGGSNVLSLECQQNASFLGWSLTF